MKGETLIKSESKKKLIIIDDDEDLLKLLTYEFHSIGFDVISFTTGAAGLAFLLDEKNLKDMLLLILDRVLPDMDGLDILHQFEKKFPHKIPVLFLSILSSEDEVIKGLQGGAIDYITKPFSIFALMQKNHEPLGTMRALVTGGAGFIGSHLCDLLIARGFEVLVLDNLCSGTRLNLIDSPLVQFVQADVRQPEQINQLFEGIDSVFHLAGLVNVPLSLKAPCPYFETNFVGTFNVLEACRKAGVKRFLYAASCSCYGSEDPLPTTESDPIELDSPYAVTKYFAEQLVLNWTRLYGLPALCLRLFNVFGPRASLHGGYGGVIGVLIDEKRRNEPLTIVGDGKQTRDFVYVTDVAEAFYRAALSPLSGESFNVGTGRAHSIEEIVQLLHASRIEYLPSRPGEAKNSCADIRKIKDMLGWAPKVSLEEGIRALL